MKPKTKRIVVHSDDGYPSHFSARRYHQPTHWLRIPIDLFVLIERWRLCVTVEDHIFAGIVSDWMKDHWDLLKTYNPRQTLALQKLLAFMVAYGTSTDTHHWGYGSKIKEVRREYS